MSIEKSLGKEVFYDVRSFHNRLAKGPLISSNYYKDELDTRYSSLIYIPSKIINANHLEVNLLYSANFDLLLQETGLPYSLKYVAAIAEMSINDSVYNDLKWYPYFDRATNTRRLLTMVPIDHLENSGHILKMKPKLFDNNAYNSLMNQVDLNAVIPFWKDVY